MTSIALDGNDYDHILDVDFIEVNIVSLPEWINDAVPDIDTNVWNKEPLIIKYTLRTTDVEKWTLDQLLTGHTKVTLTDSTYDIDINVLMIELEATWDGEINWANPWLVTIKLLKTP